ncbi:MAG: polyhydroxyalkanoate synthesis repressor PhaR [Candidatus Obscuribacterales bacterium]|nr:polyhydroxyalkanoate synthesis repressor PhaR [Steroidobacteraceae bacterium]
MSEPRVIKKYPNRRLYDTVESRYITLADIRRLVTDKVEFLVIDKKTQEDITRSILLQVISEQEHTGQPLMSQDFLSQCIRSYGGAMQNFVGNYLEQSLKLFSTQQQPNQTNAGSANPGSNTPPDPFMAMANIARQNYERWLAMQGEFLRAMSAGTAPPRPPGSVQEPAQEPADEDAPADTKQP